MKQEAWFDTQAEASAFLRGLNIGGGVSDAFSRHSRGSWLVTYWVLR